MIRRRTAEATRWAMEMGRVMAGIADQNMVKIADKLDEWNADVRKLDGFNLAGFNKLAKQFTRTWEGAYAWGMRNSENRIREAAIKAGYSGAIVDERLLDQRRKLSDMRLEAYIALDPEKWWSDLTMRIRTTLTGALGREGGLTDEERANVLAAVRTDFSRYIATEADIPKLAHLAARLQGDDEEGTDYDPTDWDYEGEAATTGMTTIVTDFFDGQTRGSRDFEESSDIVIGWQWVAVMDDRTSDEHASLDGIKLPKASPWWRGHTPPLRPRCRCTLGTIFEWEEPVEWTPEESVPDVEVADCYGGG
jgi:SPP1 gp7 family putative phage head morphogenesis protein